MAQNEKKREMKGESPAEIRQLGEALCITEQKSDANFGGIS